MQTVWVAGGSGFIGSHLCKRLLLNNFQVVCLDNLVTSSQENISSLLGEASFTFIHQDITKFSLLEAKNLPKPDFIFHLASPASPSKYSRTSYIKLPVETLLANSLGTYNLLEIAKNSHARFLYASTSEIYGNPDVSPQPETYFGNVNPIGIRSVYDEGKRFGEAIVMAYVRKYYLDGRIARIFNTFGPHMQKDDGRVVSNFILQALQNKPLTIYGNGEQTRSFCYVSDMVEGICKLMFKEGLKGEVVNLGNPNEQKIKDFATIVQRITNSHNQIIFEDLPEDDPLKRKPNITKARQLLGWEPAIRLEEGLQKTIDYFKNL